MSTLFLITNLTKSQSRTEKVEFDFAYPIQKYPGFCLEGILFDKISYKYKLWVRFMKIMFGKVREN